MNEFKDPSYLRMIKEMEVLTWERGWRGRRVSLKWGRGKISVRLEEEREI